MKNFLYAILLIFVSCENQGPLIFSATPNFSFTTKEKRIVLNGQGFDEQTIVEMQEIDLLKTIFISENQLEIIIPTGIQPGLYKIKVSDYFFSNNIEFNILHSILTIVFLNVGQGDSTLIIGPGGKTILIDAGEDGKGSDVILPYFQEIGLDKIDYFLATHYHADHIGGFDEIVAGYDEKLGTEDDILPELVFDRGDKSIGESKNIDNYLNALSHLRYKIYPSEIIDLEAGAFLECVVVNGIFKDGHEIELDFEDENAPSIGLAGSFIDFKFFIGGDLAGGGGREPYKTIDLETYASTLISDIDILRTNHHGSRTSTNENFLTNLTPEIAIISVGENKYGHPADEVIERLINHNIEIFQTGKGNLASEFSDKVTVKNDHIVVTVIDGKNWEIN